MIYFRVKNFAGDILVNSFPLEFTIPQSENEKNKKTRYLRKGISTGTFEILLVDEDRVANSNKVFNAFVVSIENILEDLTTHTSTKAREIADDHLHNIIKIHGNQKSIIERCVLNAEGESSYSDFVNSVKKDIEIRPGEFAEDLCALSNEVRLVDYHLGGYKLLSDSSSRITITHNHNVRKFLLGLCNLFFDSLKKDNVFLNVHEIDWNFLCSFEYETFNIAMHSFLENAVKYVKPYSRIDVFIRAELGELVFEMESVRIEKNEIRSILGRGIYGQNVPQNLRGSGIGMYLLKRALERSEIEFNILPDHTRGSNVDGVKYTPNTFVFRFPKYSSI